MTGRLVKCGSFIAHNQQVLTGFSMLGFDIVEDATLPRFLIVARVDDKQIVYDMQDGWTAFDLDERFLSWASRSDVYYRRSLDNRKHRYGSFSGKMRAIAPNYHCYDETVKSLAYPGIKGMLRPLLRGDLRYNRFEAVEEDGGNGKIAFLTRLYDPQAPEVENGDVAAERRQVNDTRIGIIRALRQEYGDRAICGLARDDYSLAMAPDLVVDGKITRKPAYLRKMKEASVCVASLGLHQSNGWKFAEYIAAGRAIVAERPVYEIPHAVEGRNYLSFNDVDACLHNIGQLLQNRSMRIEMQSANRDYYQCHLRPDKLVLDSFAAGDIGFGTHTSRVI